MTSNLKKTRQALDSAEWAIRKAEEAELLAYATKTRTFFEEARLAAEEARLCADEVEEAAFDALDPDEADEIGEVWELHQKCLNAALRARDAAERAQKAASGSPTATLAAEKFADKCLGIQTLEVRHSDELDFHEVSVWALTSALEQAYRAGLIDGRRGL